MTILHLLPTFNYSAAGRQVSLLAPVLRGLTPPAAVHVAALGPDGPVADALRAASIPVHALGSGRQFIPTAWWRLRRLVHELSPALVHAWRLPALRAAGLLTSPRRRRFRLVVSEPRRGGRLNWLDRRLLPTADAVVASHPAEADALCRLGVPLSQVHELPSAVEPPAEAPPFDVPLPPAAVVVMCVGSLTPGHGFRDAIWAADIVLHTVPGLSLVIVGSGPDRAGLARFARGLHPGGRHIHFVPARPDAAALLTRATVVWVPSRAECGQQVLLEAMAAGRPVVANALPGLAALVDDGRTGLLVRPGDLTALARQTRRLLDDPAFAIRLAAAGREAAAALTPERVAPAYAALYHAV